MLGELVVKKFDAGGFPRAASLRPGGSFRRDRLSHHCIAPALHLQMPAPSCPFRRKPPGLTQHRRLSQPFGEVLDANACGTSLGAEGANSTRSFGDKLT